MLQPETPLKMFCVHSISRYHGAATTNTCQIHTILNTLFKMSSIDTTRELSVTYPNEKQRNYALNIMRPPGLSSQVQIV